MKYMVFKTWPPSLPVVLEPFTFCTGSRCGQVRERGGVQPGTLLILLLFIFSASSRRRKELNPPQSTRPSSFTASRSRRRPRCCWETTTLSNRRPYSSLEPRPTDEQARLMNSALDKERDTPKVSCVEISTLMISRMTSWGVWILFTPLQLYSPVYTVLLSKLILLHGYISHLNFTVYRNTHICCSLAMWDEVCFESYISC